MPYILQVTIEQSPKFTMLMLLLLVLLSSGVGSIHCSTFSENSTDMLVLLDFKKAITNDPEGILSNYWNKSVSFCQWKGVTCSRKHTGRVTMLNLAGQGLSGTIAASVGNLTFLHTLDLSNNHLSGQIPPMNNLQKMQVLNLSYNSLDGVFPLTLTNCSDLRELDLTSNALLGQIPLEVGLLSNMVHLILYGNSLTGTIPPTLKNNTNLQHLNLGDNQIEGSIPDDLGQLSNLTELSLIRNNISGKFPEALLNVSSLKVLDLGENKLVGELPLSIGDAFGNLQQLFLGVNMFKGQIPASLGNASSLEIVFLNSNNLTGQIPTSFSKLSNLSILNLELNMLEAKDRQSWDFLYALRNCSNLAALSLKANSLQGAIPDSVGNLSSGLQILLLGRNSLSGIVPPSIGNLRGLIRLGLNNNMLTGAIEEWVAKLQNLQGLLLSVNNFVGPIPSAFGSFSSLTGLKLDSNNFEGTIPASLGNLVQLNELNLSSNKLTGEIPDTLGRCQGLLSILMDRNLLTGNIPMSFSNLKLLNVLDLSHNNLSGTIPKTLSELPDLRKLDLSYNHLYGEIPRNGVFANATAVSLDGNSGLCGGQMDLRMPPCPTFSKGTTRSYLLVKVLIPIFGVLSLILLAYFILLERKTPRRRFISLSSFGENFLKVSYDDLARATKNFSEVNLVGKGSYGSVYRGELKESKMEVAVKVFDLEMRGAERSFMSECEALRSIQHRNLLPIITACSTVDNTGSVFKALVYEFMPNGNLDTWLHHKENASPKYLGLNQRISISVNIADALDYLHHDCGRPTVHCDLKPSNILLNDDMTAILGDFGIAKLYVDSWTKPTSTISSIGLKGTIGYIPPGMF